MAESPTVVLMAPFRSPGGVTRLIDGLVERRSQLAVHLVVVEPDERPPQLESIPGPIRPLPRPRRPREMARYIATYPARQRELVKTLGSLGADAIVAFGLNVFDVLPAAERARVPLVLSLNSTRTLLGPLPIRTAARRSSAVLVEGQSVASALLGEHASNSWTFWPPVEAPQTHAVVPPPSESGTLRLGMLCNFTPQKDHLLAIAALRSAIARGIDVKLYLAGDTSEPNHYRDRVAGEAADLVARGVVSFTGHCEPTRFIEGVDALLITSRFEGVATSTLEGLALGRPFVGLPVGSLGDLACLSRGGWCTDRPRNRGEAVELLTTLIGRVSDRDRPLLVSKGLEGRTWVHQHCTWKSYITTFEMAVREAAGR